MVAQGLPMARLPVALTSFALLCMCMPGCSVFFKIPRPNTQYGVRLLLGCAKTEFVEGEPVRLRWEMENTLKPSTGPRREVQLGPGLTRVLQDPSELPVEVISVPVHMGYCTYSAVPQGVKERTPYYTRAEAMVHVHPRPKGMVQAADSPDDVGGDEHIPPGGSVGYDFLLSEAWGGGTLPPGDYKIWLEYWAQQKWPPLIRRHWHLASNAVRVRILPKGKSSGHAERDSLRQVAKVRLP